ncbi:MAG: hypothetical protein ABL908_10105 [Hyphomicrobium sp.]
MTEIRQHQPVGMPEPWHVDRSSGANPRRVLAGRTVIAYGKTVGDAHRIAHAGSVNLVLVTTLEIARDILAGHAPDFTGREAIIRLIDGAVQFGRTGERRRK